MSHWGTLEDRSGDRHIVPCMKDGTVLEPHCADINCACHPRKDHDSKGLLYVHSDPKRGGSDNGDVH